MKKCLLAVICLALSIGALAQSKDFMQVYDACMFARSAMSDGQGSKAEIARAGELLNSAQWRYLRLFTDDKKGEAPFGNETMVFNPEYLQKFSQDRKLVYKKAREYAAEEASVMRDQGKVLLCTKCIKGGKSVTYTIRQEGNTLDVAAVSEVNGLINLSVVVADENGRKSDPYKVASDEFKGAASRKIHIDKLPKGNNTIYITIENKYTKARSVAIIFE